MQEEKRKSLLFLALSFVFAVLAGFLFLEKVKAVEDQLGDSIPVLIARQPIAARTPITPDMLEEKLIPRKFVFDSLITGHEEAAGHVSLVPLQKGDVVTKSMLKQISKVNSENVRIVNLTQSERVLFDEELDAADRVDIIVSYTEAEKPVTKLLMQDIPVGRVSDAKERPKAIGVELSVEDAQKLIFMQNFARQIRVLKHNIQNPAR
ncbi:Flp pilus assembly protein CpaB [Effusibacillus lacus]|uniref:SAF domain-containing protein n=1 Tax=Effusibacillus lacus TaxID=1348429 RepID=A0A292YJZ1_9BACL|nr:SAF domain-containing protein [Effusibacillus lacus]TCS73633.1 pilus assembly protein CpaB [Effusibacillus lacus]GAX89476.1 hypothetical protein [Effusibacillus lacus]